MSVRIPVGWDVKSAVSHWDLPPKGGRIFLNGVGYLWTESYATRFPAEVGHVQDFLVDVMKWLVGTRTSGSIGIDLTHVSYAWYGYGSGEEPIGSSARSALAAAGYTVNTYTPTTASDVAAMFAANDVVFTNGASWSWGSPPLDAQTIIENVYLHDKALLVVGSNNAVPSHNELAAQCGWGYGSGSWYFNNPTSPLRVVLGDYTGAEAIFERTFGVGAGALRGLWGNSYPGSPLWADRPAVPVVGGGSNGVPSWAAPYPDGIRAGFHSHFISGSPTTVRLFALYTKHGDAGNGEDWSLQ